MKRALITGVTGQDGHYLSELLLEKGYEVFGLVRRTSRAPDVVEGVKVLEGDVTDYASVYRAFDLTDPDEVYNLAAQSYVGTSFVCPQSTVEINGLGAQNVFEAALNYRKKRFATDPRVYQAGTSEMFGGVSRNASNESTPFHPRSPYGCAKVFAHYAAQNARERGLFVCNGILFNHESPRRGPQFVTRKITQAVARIANGSKEKLELGDIRVGRDWGFAGDYVRAMWLMLQHPEPDDYVVATGRTETVEYFVEKAFAAVGLNWEDHVITDAFDDRPTDVSYLSGDASKARQELGWAPEVDLDQLIAMMVEHDLSTTPAVPADKIAA